MNRNSYLWLVAGTVSLLGVGSLGFGLNSLASWAQMSSKATTSKIESCVVKMAVVKDPNPPLNVRSVPTIAGSTIVGRLKNGTMVTVAAEQNGWFRITTPAKGWISKQNTDSGCNQKVERLTLAGAASATIADRFIGTGSHKYLLIASKGKTLTITRSKGPFPSLSTPDGKLLVDGMREEKRSRWVGQLPQDGEYALTMESNFKGYRYSFQLDMK